MKWRFRFAQHSDEKHIICAEKWKIGNKLPNSYESLEFQIWSTQCQSKEIAVNRIIKTKTDVVDYFIDRKQNTKRIKHISLNYKFIEFGKKFKKPNQKREIPCFLALVRWAHTKLHIFEIFPFKWFVVKCACNQWLRFNDLFSCLFVLLKWPARGGQCQQSI